VPLCEKGGNVGLSDWREVLFRNGSDDAMAERTPGVERLGEDEEKDEGRQGVQGVQGDKTRLSITKLHNVIILRYCFRMNPPTKSFRDLIVWQKAHEFVLRTYDLTKRFPRENSIVWSLR
jgi:23S rRNA-intervening sequence protein